MPIGEGTNGTSTHQVAIVPLDDTQQATITYRSGTPMPYPLDDIDALRTEATAESIVDLILTRLDVQEVGATLSKKTRGEIDGVVTALTALLARARKEQAATKGEDDEEDELPEDDEDEPKDDADDGDDDTAAGARKRSRSRDAALPPIVINAAEGAKLGAWLESRLHSYFTSCADDLYGMGHVTRDERIALSSAIGNALDAFSDALTDQFPGAYDRGLYAGDDDEEYVGEAKTKRDGGQNYPASDYAYVPDPNKPSTWKLRLTSSPGGAPDPGIVGAAAAALGPGFRGRKVQIPAADLGRVKAKVRAAWRKANPDKADSDMPDGIREAEFRHFTGEEVQINEAIARALSEGRKGKVKIITPGWGSSGFYPKEVLKRDGPKVFAADTHMYIDHPSRSEERDRPERSLKDLAAVISSEPEYLEKGPEGEGLYADVDVLTHWAGPLAEMAPHIGVSIRGAGVGGQGTAEGKKGFVFERLTRGDSVDFVTHAGAGGMVLDIHESAPVPDGPPAPPTPDPEPEPGEQTERDSAPIGMEAPMGDQNTETQETTANIFEELRQRRELDEANATKMRRMQMQLASRDALEMARAALAPHRWPEPVNKKIIESVVLTPPTTDDGDLDREAFTARLQESIDEMTALANAIMGPNPIRGMGEARVGEATKVTQESADEALLEEMRITFPGYSDEALRVALRH